MSLKVVRSIVAGWASDPVLMRAQIGVLQKHIPVLFLLLGSNVLALAFTHYGVAPDALTLYLPGLLAWVWAERRLAAARA